MLEAASHILCHVPQLLLLEMPFLHADGSLSAVVGRRRPLQNLHVPCQNDRAPGGHHRRGNVHYTACTSMSMYAKWSTILESVIVVRLFDWRLLQKTAVNFDDSETVEFLFKEYWLLLKRFHGYNLTNSALSCTESLSPSGSSDKHVKGDVPSLGVDQKIRSDPQKPSCNIVTATMPNTCIGLLKPSPTNESISVSKNSRFLIKRRSSSGSILPAKKKIRVLKLLNDSSSEDDNENKPLSSMLCEIKNSICSKALPITKSVSSEIILDSSVDGAYLGVKPFSVNNISSSPKPLLNVIDDSSEPLPVASSVTSPPPSPLIKPMIHPPPVPAADTSPANYSRLFKKPHSDKDLTTSPSENDRAQSLNPPACADDLVSAKELSELAFCKPRPTPGSTSKPPPMEKLSPLTAAPKPLRIKPLSLAAPAPDKHVQQLPQDTNKDMPSSNGASPDCKRPSKSLLPLKRSHGRSHAQESCRTVDATSSTCDKAEALAPITVQNVSRIYLRRSRLEELLSDQRFTLLILGAFVRIRHSKQENNYRLVQIAGMARHINCHTSAMALFFQNNKSKMICAKLH